MSTMHRICRLQSLLLLLGFLADFSSSTSILFPVFSPQPLISPRTPMAPAMLTPISNSRKPVSNSPIMLPTVSRRQGEELPLDLSKEKEPTCSELKAMWRKMRRISRQMEITNEIPKVQDPFIASAYKYRPSKYPDANPYSVTKSSKYKVFQTPNNAFDIIGSQRNFGKIISNPEDHRYISSKNQINGGGMVKSSEPVRFGFEPLGTEIQDTTYASRPHIPGRFTNSPIPEEALGVYGTVVNTPEERARFRSVTRRPPENGFRTRMLGLNSRPHGRIPFRANKPHTGYHYGREVTHYPADRSAASSNRFNARSHSMGGYAEYPPEIGQRSPASPTRVERIDRFTYADKMKNSCFRVQNKTCKIDVECFCTGSPQLFCGGNRCRPKFKAHKYTKSEKLGRSYFADPRDLDIVDYGYKMDPFWPSPF